MMKKQMPNIHFKHIENVPIQAYRLSELFEKLTQSTTHDPFAVHKIHFYLILIITKNDYHHIVDFKSYQLTEGSVLFVAKGQAQCFNKGLSKADGFAIVFESLFSETSHLLTNEFIFTRLFNYHIETPIITQSELGGNSFIQLATQLHQEHLSPNNFAKSEILSTLLHAMLLIAEKAKRIDRFKDVPPHWLDLFKTFKVLLEKEYAQTRSSRYYATSVGVSYKLLNDIVKKLTGKTVKAFILDFVMIEIKRYLVSTSLSVKEISYKTGFEEPANMIKFFKKMANETPMQFRLKK